MSTLACADGSRAKVAQKEEVRPAPAGERLSLANVANFHSIFTRGRFDGSSCGGCRGRPLPRSAAVSRVVGTGLPGAPRRLAMDSIGFGVI